MLNARYGVKYTHEIFAHAAPLIASLTKVSPDPDIAGYFRKSKKHAVSAMGLLGVMFYDIALGKRGDSREREYVRTASARLLLLTDIVDDIIDTRPTSYDEKCEILDRMQASLFGHASYEGEDTATRASFALAHSLSNGLVGTDVGGSIETIFDELLPVIKHQFLTKDPDTLLGIAKTVGSCCTDSVAALTEIVSGQEYPAMRAAARKMGEYCELSDVMCEIQEDLTEGANTYATARISSEGDTPRVRRDIKQTLSLFATDAFAEGRSDLMPGRQRDVYDVMKALIDLKYHVVDRLR